MKVLFCIATYPRKADNTPKLLKTCSTLFRNIPNDVEIHVKIIGDDYPNIKNDLKNNFKIC